MTDEELVGKLMGAIATLQGTVATQTAQINKLATEVMQLRAIIARLPCAADGEHDTNPECLQSIRPKLLSVSDDEPDSALLRQMEVSVSKSGFKSKGPAGMILAWTGLIGAIGGLAVAVWAWLRTLPHSSVQLP